MRVGELPEQPRLPHPGLADDSDDLALPRLRLLQGSAERVHLRVAADKGGQAPRGGGLQT